MTSDVVRWTGSKWMRLCSESVFKSIFYEIVVLLLVINCNVSTVKCASTASGLSGDNDWDTDLLDELSHGHFTPTWAVHIPGGDSVANIVAAEHGFVNMGKIFNDHYHFHHNTVQKRSISPSYHHQGRLDGDHRVRWAVQQRAKSRQKRDLIRIRPSRTFSVQLNDPKWPHMWYLNRGNGLDMNVIPAWKEGITGRGVVVTILDDGLESDHPDLEHNYDPQASYDVNSHDDDPMPHYDISDSNRHGTRCAGEVAATANNSLCAVGIAFGASVGGVRMLDGDVTDAVEARSLSLNPQHIDIYSASWGPDDDGKTVDGPGELATRAFIEGVKYGRSGKGSIFIWASGNGGREHDNCNCDGYTNSIWTLSISSATEEGAVPWYSEMCSSTLATTYSSGGQGEKQIVTTDLHHSCTTSHTGTSASAPLAAGIVALVLEANKNLTWRDLQHIVVRTAKPGNLNDPTWGRNGVGRRVSHSFGYGLMDAAGMVKLARTWKTVPEQQLCEINAPPLDRVIPPKGQIILTLTVEHCMGVNYLEHVQAKITLTSQRRGDIQIYLTSPAGTRVTLLTSRIHDVSRAGFSLWPFMSVHTWGEAPHGNWQLEIRNEGRYMGHAALKGWSLIFYGTKAPIDKNDPISVRPTPHSPISLNNYPPINGVSRQGGGNKNNSRKQQGGNAASTTRKNGKGSKNAGKGGKNNRTTTPRPNFTTLFGRRKETKRPDFGYTVSGRQQTTVRPRVQQPLQVLAKKGEKMHGSLSTIQDKVAVKAPKQVKENLFGNSSLIELLPTAHSRIPNVFQKYQKVQKIYPELHPYTGPNVTPKYTPYQSGLPVGYSGGGGKPSRENSKIIFFPDPDFVAAGSQQRQPPKSSSGGAPSSSAMRPQYVDVASVQRNGKAQITDWRLLFYGTAVPPQPNDPPRFGKPGQLGPDLDHNSLEFEGERASGQWRETHQVGESHVDVQRTASGDVVDHACLSYTPDKKCLECEQETFLYDGLCYSTCPEGTFVTVDNLPKSRHREGHVSLRSSTQGSLDPDDYATLEPEKRELPSKGKSLEPKVCLPCHSSCLRCRGASEAECTACTEKYDLVTLKIDSFCLKRPEIKFLGLSKSAFMITLVAFFLLLTCIPLLVVWYVRRSRISLCFKQTDNYEYNPVTNNDGSFPNFPSGLKTSLFPKSNTLTLSSDSEEET